MGMAPTIGKGTRFNECYNYCQAVFTQDILISCYVCLLHFYLFLFLYNICVYRVLYFFQMQHALGGAPWWCFIQLNLNNNKHTNNTKCKCLKFFCVCVFCVLDKNLCFPITDFQVSTELNLERQVWLSRTVEGMLKLICVTYLQYIIVIYLKESR